MTESTTISEPSGGVGTLEEAASPSREAPGTVGRESDDGGGSNDVSDAKSAVEQPTVRDSLIGQLQEVRAELSEARRLLEEARQQRETRPATPAQNPAPSSARLAGAMSARPGSGAAAPSTPSPLTSAAAAAATGDRGALMKYLRLRRVSA